MCRHLRRQKKYRKRGANSDNRGKNPRQRSIEEDPATVIGRERIGEWEADAIFLLSTKEKRRSDDQASRRFFIRLADNAKRALGSVLIMSGISVCHVP